MSKKDLKEICKIGKDMEKSLADAEQYIENIKFQSNMLLTLI